VEAHDNEGLPFVIVDKKGGRIFVFEASGLLRGASPALTGLAPGDHGVPGMAQRSVASLRDFERTTPAGRFVSEPGHNLQGTCRVRRSSGSITRPSSPSTVCARRRRQNAARSGSLLKRPMTTAFPWVAWWCLSAFTKPWLAPCSGKAAVSSTYCRKPSPWPACWVRCSSASAEAFP
jgi:hypothetical protein